MTMLRNLVTDVAGISVGHAQDLALGSGVTAMIFDTPAAASIAVHGGAPGLRDTALLEPDMTVGAVDALVLSGGSAFGLDAMGGVQAWLRAQGRGFDVRGVKVPIVPGAILFDLLNGGDKDWGRMPPWWELGHQAASAAAHDFALGSVGAGTGATTANYKGGLGSTSAVTSRGFRVGALVAVNALGSAVIGDGPQFWAGLVEHGSEFGGFGVPPRVFHEQLAMRVKGDEPENTTIAIVVTDAALTKAQLKRIAVMAHDGIGRALRPTHAMLDGDVVFAAATAGNSEAPTMRDLTEIGMVSADCLARAIARGVYEATALPYSNAQPAWRDRFGDNG